MQLNPRNRVVTLLGLSALLLALLIPGGPIENRDFSHIHPVILGGFNIFLTVLNLGSIALIVLVIRHAGRVGHWVVIVAMLYFAVYALDLAQLFPRSPTPMTQPLALIEVLGMIVAVPLMFAARSLVPASAGRHEPMMSATGRWWIGAAVLIVGAVIVVFATDSAINSPADTAVAAGSTRSLSMAREPGEFHNECCDASAAEFHFDRLDMRAHRIDRNIS